jgi:hypothetical protein
LTALATGLRLGATAASLVGATAFLLLVGPASPPAFADIFGAAVNPVFLAPPGGHRSAPRRETLLVNGQTFHMSIGHTPRSPEDVLAEFERQFDVTVPGSRDRVTSAAAALGGRAGAVAGIQMSGASTSIRSGAPGLGRLAETGRLSDVGRFHLVLALQQRDTVFVDLSTGDDVNLRTLFPADGGDAPGADVPGIQRPAGLQRMLTIEHGAGPAQSRTVIYRSVDGRSPTAAFQHAFRAAGWTRNPLTPGGALVHFTGHGRDAFVGGGDGDGSTAVVVSRLSFR